MKKVKNKNRRICQKHGRSGGFCAIFYIDHIPQVEYTINVMEIKLFLLYSKGGKEMIGC